jgi:ATP-binding cassette, subfamily C (CFTR/MRP), member 1
VSLRYRPKTELVLHDITFKIAPGEKVGICGRTGSGKSTIAQTLSRIMELEKGSIKIDGLEISKQHLKQLRSKITVIPQDPTLFKGTLRFNLDPFEVCPEH